MTAEAANRDKHALRIAVVVMSYGLRRSLASAVRSVQDQDEPAEIVVVHSGDGDVLDHFRQSAVDVRVVQSSTRLLPGATRNHCDASACCCIPCRRLPRRTWMASRKAKGSRRRSSRRRERTPVSQAQQPVRARCASKLVRASNAARRTGRRTHLRRLLRPRLIRCARTLS